MQKLNQYEALFILNTAGKDEGVQEILSHIESEIKGIGGQVESIQKMDRRQFARRSHRMSSGYYVNVLFSGPPESEVKLRGKFRLDDRIFRVLFLRRDVPKPKKVEKEVTKTRG